MGLEITMKPRETVEEVFESAELMTKNCATVYFKGNEDYVQMNEGYSLIQSSCHWNASALRELADACQQIATILDQQDD